MDENVEKEIEALFDKEEYQEVAIRLKPLYEVGDPSACYILAQTSLHSQSMRTAVQSCIEEISDEKAIKLIEYSAKAGLPEAQYEYSQMVCYTHKSDEGETLSIGWEPPESYYKLKYLAKSAKASHPDALFQYGKRLFVSKNKKYREKGKSYLKLACKKGHVEASLCYLLSLVVEEKETLVRLLKSVSSLGDADKQYSQKCLGASSLLSLIVNNNLLSLSEFEKTAELKQSFDEVNSIKWESLYWNPELKESRLNKAVESSVSLLNRTYFFLKEEGIDNDFIRNITKDLYSANTYKPIQASHYVSFLKSSKEYRDECVKWCAFLSSCYTETMFLFSSNYINSSLEDLYLDDKNIVKKDGSYTLAKPVSFFTVPSLFAQLSPVVPEVSSMLVLMLNKGMVIDIRGLASYIPVDAPTDLLEAYLPQLIERCSDESSYIHSFIYRHAKRFTKNSVKLLVEFINNSEIESGSWLLDSVIDLYLYTPHLFDDLTKQPFRDWLYSGAFDNLTELEEFIESGHASDNSYLLENYEVMSKRSEVSTSVLYSHLGRVQKENENKYIGLINIWIHYLVDLLTSNSKFEQLKGLAHLLIMTSSEVMGEDREAQSDVLAIIENNVNLTLNEITFHLNGLSYSGNSRADLLKITKKAMNKVVTC